MKNISKLEEALKQGAKNFVNSHLHIGKIGSSGRSILFRLTGLQPEIGAISSNAIQLASDRIQKEIRQECRRSRSGSLAYDFNRHIALHQAFKYLQDTMKGAISE